MLKPNNLPHMIPIFPLEDALLLPGGELPLNIFEPRYLAMVRQALAGDRMIGIIQPDGKKPPPHRSLYKTGCAGRISSFFETPDGRFLITLTGVCRFHLSNDILTENGYRQGQVEWKNFKNHDTALTQDFEDAIIDRDVFIPRLKAYMQSHDIELEWDKIATIPDQRLLTCIAMVCPFDTMEKQALLEAPDLTQRYGLLLKLLEINVGQNSNDNGGNTCH